MAGYNDPESGYTVGAGGLFTHLGHITDITNKFDKDATPASGDVLAWNGSVYVPVDNVPDAAEKIVYVTPRGNDSNDGFTLKTAKLTIAAALTALAGGGTVQLGVGSFSTSAFHGLSTGTKIIGAGPGLTTITYTGSGSLFGNATLGTRIYHCRLIDLTLNGPGIGTTAVAVDMADMSLAVIDGLNISTFGTAIKVTATAGGATYNDFTRCAITSCGIGADLAPTATNSSRWRGVRFLMCTTGIKIVDSNQHSFLSCQLETNTTAISIDAPGGAGTSDHNVFFACRFEGNTTAWNIVSANVRDTSFLWPAFFGATGTLTDNGTRTVFLASHGTAVSVPGTQRRVNTRTSDYTVDAAQDVVLMNGSSATATLPSAVTATAGRQFKIKNIHATSLAITSASGTIDGATTVHLGQNQAATFVSNGTNWFRVAMPSATTVDVDWTRPSAALSQTFPRNTGTLNYTGITSGVLFMVGIPLIGGQVISTITFVSATTALAGGSNQWFALYSAARALLGVTNDDTTTAWAADASKTLTLAASYTVPTSGLYYLALNVVATTMPTFRAITTTGRILTQTPILAGTSTTGLTDPASAPATAAAITVAGSMPYAFVS